jgi:S1-C subfamily serine protease
MPAELVASSLDSTIGNLDFAVLVVRGGKSLVPLPVGDEPSPLDSVIAAGFPGLTVSSDPDGVSPDVVFSQGEVSVVQPQPNGVGLVIHTANIAPGSSGGPLLNRCGVLVGVNTFVGTGDQADGRALYSLSPAALADYLTSVGLDFRHALPDCASGGS